MENIFCHNQLTYEEILNWRGFAFETSRVDGLSDPPMGIVDGEYGIADSERIMDNVVCKSKGRK